MQELYIGIIAGVFTSIASLPQLIKTIRTKEAGDISVIMLVLLILGLCAWVIYGWLRKDFPVLITNAVALIINILLLIFRMMYQSK